MIKYLIVSLVLNNFYDYTVGAEWERKKKNIEQTKLTKHQYTSSSVK